MRTWQIETKKLLTEQDFIVEIEGFDRFMLVLNDKLKHPSLIDLDNVENSVLVKNVIQQVKNYQEQLRKLGQRRGHEGQWIKGIRTTIAHLVGLWIKSHERNGS